MTEIDRFPWTYDQYLRYSVLREFVSIFYSDKKIKVLDVGGLSPDRTGRFFWFPLKHVFSGECLIVDVTYCKENDFVQGNGLCLPFKNNSFEVAAALDVVEHIVGDEREIFLKELCRVAKSSIVLSAPFWDDEILTVEELLFEQLKRTYGVEHVQLSEHKRHRLPEIDSISSILKKYMASNVNFSYGSLKNWLFLQTLKNSFMFRKSSGKIHSFFDKWMAFHSLPSEFDLPYSRHFWIHSKEINQRELKHGFEKLKNNLKNKKPVDLSFQEITEFNKEIVNFYCRDRVSALVVVSGSGKHLSECLNHLLTQSVDFDLEVVVWDISGKVATEKMIKARFPDLKYLRAEKREKTTNALIRAIAPLIGNYILILADNVLLPRDSVFKFHERLKESPSFNVLSPRVIWKRYFSSVWSGRVLSIKKLFAGRAYSPFWESKGEKIRWLFSECLFIKRNALFERKFRGSSLRKRDLFLWEKTNAENKILYVPDLVVFKKK